MRKIHTLLIFCFIAMTWSHTKAQVLSGSISEQGDVLCHGDSSGYAIANATGGTAPYNYKIDNGSFSSTKFFPNLLAGTYEITILDATFDSVKVSLTINEPAPFRLSITDNTPVTCFGDSTGSLRVLATGGLPPYEYSLNNGFFSNNIEFKDLPSAAYLVIARDSNLCVDDSIVSLGSNAPVSTFLQNQRDASCKGISDGQIQLGASGGTGGYEFSINGGTFQPNGLFPSLGAGNYSIIVQDDSACTGEIIVTINEPDTVGMTFFSQDISCFGANNALISLQGSGGTPPYSYTIDGTAFQFQNEYGGLGTGIFPVQVKDINGCESRIDQVIFADPPQLELTLTGTDITCNGGSDGVISSDISGGTAPYNLVWNDLPGTNDPILTNQSAGAYFAVVVDANGCEAGDNLLLEEPAQSIDISTVEVQDADCGGMSGVIEIAPFGGIEPYEILWDGIAGNGASRLTNLDAGTYSATVTDALGCASEISFELSASDLVNASFGASRDLNEPLILTDAQVSFTNQTQGAIEYLWDFGDGIGVSQERFPVYTYTSAGEFTITLIALDPGLLCPDTATRTITVLPQETLYMPSAFTPDGDSRNDAFEVNAIGLSDLSLTVFDRWGRPIRTLLGVNNPWDGRNAAGQLVYPGVYAYHVRAVFQSGYIMERSGTVTVMR